MVSNLVAFICIDLLGIKTNQFSFIEHVFKESANAGLQSI